MLTGQSCMIVKPHELPEPEVDIDAGGEQVAVLAGGCFWCVEAVFKRLEGVTQVTSGYAGDAAETADYRTVCSGSTEHAEVVEVRFDSSVVSYGGLLKVFFAVAHDPTQLDRQGNDVGRQYRSAVFAVDEEQRSVAEAYIAQLEEASVFSEPIVTAVEDLVEFFAAEDYHQDYADLNPTQPYIASVSAPKVEKLREHFADRLIDEG